MALNEGFEYPALTTDTQIRVLILAPSRDDTPIIGFHLVIDLDADWELPSFESRSWPALGPKGRARMEIKDDDGEVVLGFTMGDIQYQPDDEHSFYPFQRYSALSYVWGDQSNPHKIYLNNKEFYIGHNLYLALRQHSKSMRSSTIEVERHNDRPLTNPQEDSVLTESRLLWIDAMCINQSDIAEREAQVKLMARIYRQADHVHANLGYEGDGNDDGIKLVHLLRTIMAAGSACKRLDPQPNDAMGALAENAVPQSNTPATSHADEQPSGSRKGSKVVARIRKTWKSMVSKRERISGPVPATAATSTPSLQAYGAPPEDDEIWDWAVRFYGSPYFRRLWIIQEFALAKKITLWFGNFGLEPLMVITCLLYCESYNRGGLQFGASGSPENPGLINQSSNFSGVVELMVQRKLVHEAIPDISTLLSKLNIARGSLATDQRDKIYGMLSLALDSHKFLSLVSYSKSVTEVYLDFARRFVELGQGMEMLYQVDSSSSKALDIPTWVPDWSQPLRESPVFRFGDSQASHSASKAKQPGLQLSSTDSTLIVDGALFDTITRLSEPLHHDLGQVKQVDLHMLFQEGRQIAWELDKSRDSTDIADMLLWTALHDFPEPRPPEEAERLLDGLWTLLTVSLWAPDTLLSLNIRTFLRETLKNVLGRSWCSTENGYFGLVPGGTQIGDRVAIFYGGPIPFIVRPHSTAQDANFILVGHGYFGGLRKGEAFDLPAFEPQKIVLV